MKALLNEVLRLYGWVSGSDWTCLGTPQATATPGPAARRLFSDLLSRASPIVDEGHVAPAQPTMAIHVQAVEQRLAPHRHVCRTAA